MTALGTAQLALFDTASVLPAGLRFEAGFVTDAAERELLAVAASLPLQEARYKQYTARRRVHFLDRDAPMPQALCALREALARWAGVAPQDFVHTMVAEYRRGTPLGWHRDAPRYELIAGVSLGSPARLRFRPWPPEDGRREDIVELHLAPRSAYMIAGPARWAWQHGVPPVPALRHSVTMRTARVRAACSIIAP